MSRLSKDTPISELCHSAMRKGSQKADHKYIYREWKNGRWVYYYEDGSSATELPKGRNYKTEKQVAEETKAVEAAKVAINAKQKEKADREDRTWSKIENVIGRGKEKLKKIEYFLATPIANLPDYIHWATRDSSK